MVARKGRGEQPEEESLNCEAAPAKNTGTLTAKEKRILVTHFVGAAWQRIFDGRSNTRAYFERTGCLLTIDGSEDSLVEIRGATEKYKVTPIAQINPALYPHFHSEDTDAPDEEPEVPDDVIDQEDNFEIFDTDETGDEEIEEDLLVHI